MKTFLKRLFSHVDLAEHAPQAESDEQPNTCFITAVERRLISHAIKDMVLTPFSKNASAVIFQALRVAGTSESDALGCISRAIWGREDVVTFHVPGRFSTSGANPGLTELVLLAHENCIDVTVSGCSPTHVKIILTAKKRLGSANNTQPTIEEVLLTRPR